MDFIPKSVIGSDPKNSTSKILKLYSSDPDEMDLRPQQDDYGALSPPVTPRTEELLKIIKIYPYDSRFRDSAVFENADPPNTPMESYAAITSRSSSRNGFRSSSEESVFNTSSFPELSPASRIQLQSALSNGLDDYKKKKTVDSSSSLKSEHSLRMSSGKLFNFRGSAFSGESYASVVARTPPNTPLDNDLSRYTQNQATHIYNYRHSRASRDGSAQTRSQSMSIDREMTPRTEIFLRQSLQSSLFSHSRPQTSRQKQSASRRAMTTSEPPPNTPVMDGNPFNELE